MNESYCMVAVVLALGLVACSGDAGDPSDLGPSSSSAGTSSSSNGGTSGAPTNPSSAGNAALGGAATGGNAAAGSATGGASAGTTALGGSTTGGSATGGSTTGGSTTGGSATGGSTTGGVAACTEAPPPSPPADMKQTIDLTWQEMTGGFSGKTGARGPSRAIQTYPSWALDHVMWGKGNLNFCVKWDSEQPVSTTLRDQVASTLQRGVDAWFSALYGYDCFPFSGIKVKVTGWATRNRSTFEWTDDPNIPVFINSDAECPDACARSAHHDGTYQFPNCLGGFANRFDQSLWLTENYDSPNGWDDFQHVDRKGFTDTVSGTGLYHIWLHEFGHGIGFPDYYDWDTWAPGVEAPACVMNAGAAAKVTDWDKWMLKRTWSELRAKKRWQ